MEKEESQSNGEVYISEETTTTTTSKSKLKTQRKKHTLARTHTSPARIECAQAEKRQKSGERKTVWRVIVRTHDE